MTRLSPEELASINQHMTAHWVNQGLRQQLFAHVASLEAELALTRNALLDLLQESHAYAAGKADTRAEVRNWLEDRSSWHSLSEWAKGPYTPPPDGALLARLAEALDVLQKIVSAVEPDFPELAGQDEVVEIHLHYRPNVTWANATPGLTVGHIRRAAEISAAQRKSPGGRSTGANRDVNTP